MIGDNYTLQMLMKTNVRPRDQKYKCSKCDKSRTSNYAPLCPMHGIKMKAVG